MSRFSIYSYAWDIEEIGADRFVDEIRALGLTGVTLACAYHAGKFLRPRGLRGKNYFPEDGTVYFHHDSGRYGRLRPLPWSGLNRFDPLAEVARAAPDLGRTAWLVCCHNSRLGFAYPEVTARNCFGDSYGYSLNPAHPDVREYVVALCADIACNQPVDTLVLETPGWLPFAHGYHHEFAMRPIDPWLALALGTCFADASIQAAEAAGVDAMALRNRVREAIESCLAAGLAVDDGRAGAWMLADLVGDADWLAYHRWRQASVTALVAAVQAELPTGVQLKVIPSVRRPTAGAWIEGSDLYALAGVCDGIEICAYEPNAHAVALDLADVTRRLGEAPRAAVIRPGHPDLAGGEQAAAAAAILRDGGVRDLAFYNYGHLDQPSLDRIPSAIAAFRG